MNEGLPGLEQHSNMNYSSKGRSAAPERSLMLEILAVSIWSSCSDHASNEGSPG